MNWLLFWIDAVLVVCIVVSGFFVLSEMSLDYDSAVAFCDSEFGVDNWTFVRVEHSGCNLRAWANARCPLDDGAFVCVGKNDSRVDWS
jgi:hypothetical protein